MEKYKVGKIVNTFGLKGELKVLFDEYVKLNEFFIGGVETKFKCEKQIDSKKFTKVKMQGFDDINQVTQFIGRDIFIESEAESEILDEDEYYVDDLIGSNLFDGEKFLGTIIDVENYGASDIFVFESDGKEMRVPFVLDYFENIDIKNKTIKITKKFYEGAV